MPLKTQKVFLSVPQDFLFSLYVMPCAIWYHSYNLKNVKNTHGALLYLKTLYLNIKFHTLYIFKYTITKNVAGTSEYCA